MKTILIIANFFVHHHGVDNNAHTYELFGVMNQSIEDSGVEHFIAYTGPKLPVDDAKKFYAEILAECEDFSSMEHGRNVTRRVCTATKISF
jgi:hypothetical protein